jgi:excisionase family DNA binding protein
MRRREATQVEPEPRPLRRGLLSDDQAMEILGVKRNKLDWMMKNGLRVVKFGTTLKIDPDDLDEYIEQHKVVVQPSS